MKLFRSEEMAFCNIAISHEYAWEVINELGDLDVLQFIDLNAHELGFVRPYSNHIKRCEGMELKIATIEQEMLKFNRNIAKCQDPKEFIKDLKEMLASRNKAERTFFDEVEHDLDERLENLKSQLGSYETLAERYNHLVEYKQVLLKTRSFTSKKGFRVPTDPNNQSKAEYFTSGHIKFEYLAGVLDTEDTQAFRRLLFRATRGMTWNTFIDVHKAKSEQERYDTSHFLDKTVEFKPKTVFLIVYQSGPYNALKVKLDAMCNSFGVSKYGVPENSDEVTQKVQEIDNQLLELQNVLKVTRMQIERFLDYFSRPRKEQSSYSLLEEMKMFVLKEKAVYHHLNMLRLQNSVYRGNCWCPQAELERVQERITQLNRVKADVGSCSFQKVSAGPHDKPPTCFKTNAVTWVFQEIVNTYGHARYREINPGLFTIATFPFLFGVMFGDIGHGGLLLAAGLYLLFWRKEIEADKESLWKAALPLRFLLTMQGFFALYCGLIYNDFMAIPLRLFTSCYEESNENPDVLEKTDIGCNYPLGIDPGWYGTTNELTFMNSFKMKLSIVLGVSHMIFGILLRGLNNLYFRQWVDFFFEFIPMLLFMSLTFGYMAVLIFLKWSIPWGTPEYPTSQAPSIIGIFIKMALQPGSWSPDMGMPLYGDRSGEYQANLQKQFLMIAMTCAVLILVPKPLILWIKNQASNKSPAGYFGQVDEPSTIRENKKALLEEQPQSGDVVHGHGDGHGHFDFGDIFVHQIIETIEFVLGSISNTASYLRLWALSLAHSQLAKVFFTNFLTPAISSGSVIGAFFGFHIFIQITVNVLLLMDQMECFLHALRLHWVEFNNKFYKADGIPFTPFSFEKALSQTAKQ